MVTVDKTFTDSCIQKYGREIIKVMNCSNANHKMPCHQAVFAVLES